VRLGLSTGYWGAGPPAGVPEMAAAAESLGYESLWTAEAYGSDALTPLAWWGSRTSTMKLGTSIVQMSARTPAATAMAAMTLDHLSGGRFILGLGASGPQVVEGWYGQPYPRPLARTREYIEIIRRIVARDDRVEFDGEQYQLPFRNGTGLGKPLKSTIHPYRTELPVYLGAEGPKNIALAAEICDGWLPWLYSPRHDDFYRRALQEGFDRGGSRRSWDDFEIACMGLVIPGDDLEACADFVRPIISLYVGGMGAKEANFHNRVFVRMGYEAECDRIQELYLEGDKAAATASVSLAMCEEIALLGSWDKIRDELQLWEDSVITTLLVNGDLDLVRRMAELCL
jgi:F420-dependent oxidoreductase-like protein